MNPFILTDNIRRFTRQADGSLHLEQYSMTPVRAAGVLDFRCEVFKVIDDQPSASLGTRWWYVQEDDCKTVIKQNTMPDNWQPASEERLWAIAKKQSPDPEPATNNVVTFAVYRENGAMMGQMRSFVSPQGKPIGNPGMPSMHGGLIEDFDFGYMQGFEFIPLQAGEQAVMREVSEEFGVRISTSDIVHLGDVYDADNGRFNHVYHVTKSFEQALKDTYGTDIDGMLKAIFDCEGIGRLTRLFREDLERAMEIGGITPISIAILKAFPELMPPPASKE